VTTRRSEEENEERRANGALCGNTPLVFKKTPFLWHKQSAATAAQRPQGVSLLRSLWFMSRFLGYLLASPGIKENALFVCAVLARRRHPLGRYGAAVGRARWSLVVAIPGNDKDKARARKDERKGWTA
jgi:hypothetical protein